MNDVNQYIKIAKHHIGDVNDVDIIVCKLIEKFKPLIMEVVDDVIYNNPNIDKDYIKNCLLREVIDIKHPSILNRLRTQTGQSSLLNFILKNHKNLDFDKFMNEYGYYGLSYQAYEN